MAGSDLNPTLNKSGQGGASPENYDQHLRHSNYARMRHSQQLIAFLAAQATRLSTTSATIFAKLAKHTAARIKQVTSLSQIP